jgi:hypothetical protein
MPKQESFFDQREGDRRVEVLKSYDSGYAREAFNCMGDDARQRLWNSLKPEEIYDPEGLPSLADANDTDGEAEAFLWDELMEQAREDGNTMSFFIVNESTGGQSESLYVAPDWPSAEAFAKTRLAASLVI